MDANRRAIIILTVGIFLGVLLSLGVAVFTRPYEKSTEEQVSIDTFEERDKQQLGFKKSITVYHDNKRNVTCWLFKWKLSGGISCIPDHMLVP